MKRVAVYCRVSTDKTDQVNSFNSQKLFFSRYIENIPDWLLTGIYADEGISGTTAARTGFLKMLDDASRGCFDILITKEVSRFSRNILDAIAYTRKLKEMSVGVVFLNDNISTLDPDSELRLAIMASVAQEESRRTSERVRWGQLRQMEKGVVFGRSLLGYDLKNGELTIEPDGAGTVRRIFGMYLNDRMGVRAIAKALNDSGTPTKSGSAPWSGAAVLKVIRNEKYCGDLLQKKTVTADYLTHKKERNRNGDLIYIRDHHQPIISREDWDAAQTLRLNRSHRSEKAVSCGTKYALSGRVFCAGCGALYCCRTRKRKNNSIYRVWSCGSCRCQSGKREKKRGYICEETLSGSVRHIIKSYGRDTLAEGLSELIAKVMKDQDISIIQCENKIARIEEKIRKLLDVYIAGDIGRDEYFSMKRKYESELEKHGSVLSGLKASKSGENTEEAVRLAALMAQGEEDDTDFYLSLVDHIDVISDFEIDVLLLNSAGKWRVEFI